MDGEGVRFLITGSGGWICTHLVNLLGAQGKSVHATNYRLEDSTRMNEIFDEVNPTHVINCAGRTGFPNVDWCEENRNSDHISVSIVALPAALPLADPSQFAF